MIADIQEYLKAKEKELALLPRARFVLFPMWCSRRLWHACSGYLENKLGSSAVGLVREVMRVAEGFALEQHEPRAGLLERAELFFRSLNWEEDEDESEQGKFLCYLGLETMECVWCLVNALQGSRREAARAGLFPINVADYREVFLREPTGLVEKELQQQDEMIRFLREAKEISPADGRFFPGD